MVPLENRSGYLSKIEVNAKLKAFRYFIVGKQIVALEGDLKEIDKLYHGILSSISKSDKSAFDKLYSQLSKRKVSAESASPFVYDDAFVFSLIVGIIKFGYETDWIQQVVEARGSHDIPNTFKSILKGDYTNKVNLPQVIIVFNDLVGKNSLPEDYINDAYKQIVNNHTLFEDKNDFTIILSLRAFDLILLSKNTEEGALSKLKKFETTFLKRTKWLSMLIYNIVLLIILYSIWMILSSYPIIKENVNEIGTILGILGIQLLGNLIPYIKSATESVVRRFFGYQTRDQSETSKRISTNSK